MQGHHRGRGTVQDQGETLDRGYGWSWDKLLGLLIMNRLCLAFLKKSTKDVDAAEKLQVLIDFYV